MLILNFAIKKYYMQRIICLFSLILICVQYFTSCKNSAEEDRVTEKRQYLKQQNKVDVKPLESVIFYRELVSNGKLRAKRKSELRFEVSEKIESILVKNGDFVQKGQLLAKLYPFNLEQALTKAEIQLKSSRLELQNILIGQGYNLTDSANIPKNIKEMADIRSGYRSARNEMVTARHKLDASNLIAPFSGKIANIRQKEHEQLNGSEAFCTLIDDSMFEVEFNVIENEIPDIRLGGSVQISPFSSTKKSYKGTITEINPIIDDNGLIQVKAELNNPGDLMEGMNVTVLIEKQVPDQLVVPKSAVVLRQNQEVLFKCTNDSVAFWTYVKTLYENSGSYSVIAHPDKGGKLEAGDTIIISGNLNLAHESIVKVNWK